MAAPSNPARAHTPAHAGPRNDVIDVVSDFLEPSMELLRFYRGKILDFEAERSQYLQRLSELEAQIVDTHRLRWELSAREDEIRELQNALHDAKLYLYDERQQLLTLQAENDSLKAQEIEDRRRIQHLLAMTQPVGHEVTFFRDAAAPGLLQHGAIGTQPSALRAPMPLTQAPRDIASPSRAQTPAGDKPRVGAGVLRSPAGVPLGREAFPLPSPADASRESASTTVRQTVPSAAPAPAPAQGPLQPQAVGHDTLMSTIESLRRQLEDARLLYEERVKAFTRDRDALKADSDRKAAADSTCIRQLEKQLQTTTDKYTSLTRDYLLMRHSFSQRERAAAEEIARCKAEAHRAQAELRDQSETVTKETRVLREQADTTQRSLKTALQSRIEQVADEFRVSEARHQSEAVKLREQIEKLKAMLQKEKQKYADLQARRALENEGYNTDVTFLRKSLRQLERQWAMLDGAVADNELQAAMREASAAMREMMGRLGGPRETIVESNQEVYPDDLLPSVPVQLGVAQHLPALARGHRRSVLSCARSRGSSRGRSRSASAASSSRWGGLAPSTGPSAWEPVPAAGADVVTDPQQRSRLRVKGALLQNHPVLYRSVRSSGYGKSGRGKLVDPTAINEAATGVPLYSLSDDSMDAGEEDNEDQPTAEHPEQETPQKAGPSAERRVMSGGARRVRVAEDENLYVSGVSHMSTPSSAGRHLRAQGGGHESAIRSTTQIPRAATPQRQSETDAVRSQLLALRERIRALDAKVGKIATSQDSTPTRPSTSAGGTEYSSDRVL